jgi:hypothetical protein
MQGVLAAARLWSMDTTENPYTDPVLAACWATGYADDEACRTYDDDPFSPRSTAYDEGASARESDDAKRLHGGRGYVPQGARQPRKLP